MDSLKDMTGNPITLTAGHCSAKSMREQKLNSKGAAMKKVTMLWVFVLSILISSPVKACEYTFPITDSELSRLYSCREDKNCDTCISITQEEAQMLMKLACSETGDMGEDAQLLVMNVVINRLNDKDFPDNIYDIIHAEKQFSVVQNGAFDKVKPNVESHFALARLEMGEDLSEGALYFESNSAKDTWQSRHKEFLFEKYGQRYYKDP